MKQQEAIKVAVSLDDGSVALMSFVTVGRGSTLPSNAEWREPGLWRRSPLDGELFEEISRAFTSGPAVTGYAIVREQDLPTDRTYRDAWTFVDGKVQTDIEKAKALHLARLRIERDERLRKLDNEWMRAFGSGDVDQATRLEEQRRLLRDMPERFAFASRTANTEDALKRLTLDLV